MTTASSPVPTNPPGGDAAVGDEVHQQVVAAAGRPPSLRVWESEGGHLLRSRDRGPIRRWVPAGPLTELADSSAVHADLAGVPVCLVRSAGTVYALLDECSHGQVALSDGEVEDGFVECWLHGSRFDLATGRPTGPPATLDVPVYPVRVTDGVVEVALPAPADTTTPTSRDPR